MCKWFDGLCNNPYIFNNVCKGGDCEYMTEEEEE